jgi:hypothetical protein
MAGGDLLEVGREGIALATGDASPKCHWSVDPQLQILVAAAMNLLGKVADRY